MIKLLLVRHGQSTWNAENKFTGWTDVDLTRQGRMEAAHAAQLIKEQMLVFDLAYTSYLTRASETLRIILEGLGQHPPIKTTWRLNERHYGALQGLNKKEMVEQYGEEQVKLWRRSYDVRPPALTRDDLRWPGHDPRYKELSPEELPLTESLKDCLARVIPFWESEIAPQLHAGRRVIIAASGNSLRALIKHLDCVPDDEIPELNVPTGIPLVYEIDEKTLTPLRHYYLEDEAKVKAAIDVVKHQT